MAANTTNKTVVTVVAIICSAFIVVLLSFMIMVGFNYKTRVDVMNKYDSLHEELQSLGSQVDSISAKLSNLNPEIQTLIENNNITRRDISNIQYRINKFDQELTDIFD